MISRNANPIVLLSKREKEIFLLLLSGSRTKAIADKLSLKSNTISTVIKNLKVKTGAKTLVDLLNLGYKFGYTTPSDKVQNHKETLSDLGYSFSHAYEIGKGKTLKFIRFEYWTKSNSLFLAEIVNGECTSFFAEQTPD